MVQLFKFNNFGLALGMTLKFYTSVTKGLKVTGEKLVGESFLPPILNRVNNDSGKLALID